MLKARPISPHTAVNLKRVYNKVATALLYILQQIRDQRTARLWNPDQYITRATEEWMNIMKLAGKPVKIAHQL